MSKPNNVVIVEVTASGKKSGWQSSFNLSRVEKSSGLLANLFIHPSPSLSSTKIFRPTAHLWQPVQHLKNAEGTK
jgi:hypothetical protein